MAMTGTKALTEQTTPLETLTSIGFTRDEANAFLSRIENSFTTETVKTIRYSQQRRNYLSYQKFLTVIWGYAFTIWVYVIAMQLRFPDSVRWPLALWLPVRMDYLGEIVFASSFILACVITIGNPKSTTHPSSEATISN